LSIYPSKTVVFLPDIHFRKKPGGEDRRTLDAVKNYLSDTAVDEIVFAGDVMDHNSISSHNVGNLRAVSGETLDIDYEHANKGLDEIHQAAPDAKFVMIEGNHDWRPEALINAQPQLKGRVETPLGLKLKKRGWLWVPYWSQGTVYDVGKASFGHGRYTNLHHAYKHALSYGRNFYYGHLHDVQSHTVERAGDNEKYEASSMGCLCSYRQYWLKGRPTRWQQAFGVFHFLPNGFYNKYTVRIFNHRFVSPEGKIYKG
jgi:predicted phosphodiesterase